MPKLVSGTTLAGVLAVSLCGTASAATLFVDTGPSSQNFTLYGQGAYSPGLGSFTIGQGAGSYDSGTNTSTFILSGAITGGSPGLNSGTYEFITTYSGNDTPEAGPNAPQGHSNPSNSNEFFYSLLDPSTTMTFDLFGTPTGNHVIPLVAGGSFLGPGFGFSFTTASCTGSPMGGCGQNNVGLTPGTSIFGPVDISVSFSSALVPEPSTWALLFLGFAGLGFAGYRKAKTGRRAHFAA
ncbi:MAG: PEP-CTERM sorting domain-containing protein [Hyphomicrobiales bacterium]|nr:PEP-CTERM sorting domain-containing protein [Hyphomicrobiales bacterium]